MASVFYAGCVRQQTNRTSTEIPQIETGIAPKEIKKSQPLGGWDKSSPTTQSSTKGKWTDEELKASYEYVDKLEKLISKPLFPFKGEIQPTGNLQADIQLIEAIRNLDVQGVKDALKAGANPNLRATQGQSTRTPISFVVWTAMFSHSPEKLDHIHHEKDPVWREIKTRVKASHMQDYLTILQLLFDAGAKEPSWNQCVALRRAARHDLAPIVEILLKNGFEHNTCGDLLTPIEIAEQQMHERTVQVFIRNGVKPLSAETKAHLHFIHYAQEHNVAEMDKILVNHDFVNRPDKEGTRALNEAVRMVSDPNWYASISYLLQKGANPNLLSTYFGKRETALHTIMKSTDLAMEIEEFEPFALLGIEALLKAGADVSSRDEDGQTPLHRAAQWDNLKGAIMLIEAGAKVTAKDNDGKMPLDYAESTTMIKLLKSHGTKER